MRRGLHITNQRYYWIKTCVSVVYVLQSRHYFNKGNIMIIAGFRMKDDGYGITVSEHEAGWSFFLQGDDADQFRNEWEAADLAGINFKSFLYNHEYTQLFT